MKGRGYIHGIPQLANPRPRQKISTLSTRHSLWSPRHPSQGCCIHSQDPPHPPDLALFFLILELLLKPYPPAMSSPSTEASGHPRTSLTGLQSNARQDTSTYSLFCTHHEYIHLVPMKNRSSVSYVSTVTSSLFFTSSPRRGLEGKSKRGKTKAAMPVRDKARERKRVE